MRSPSSATRATGPCALMAPSERVLLSALAHCAGLGLTQCWCAAVMTSPVNCGWLSALVGTVLRLPQCCHLQPAWTRAPHLTSPHLTSPPNCGCRYRYGPQPADFDGQRALDFVLDNNTLNDTNRT